MRDLVSYRISIKLMEKGFPQHLSDDFYADGEGVWVEDFSTDSPTFNVGDLVPDLYGIPTDGDEIAAPTIYQVIKWLRDFKYIYVYVEPFPTMSTKDKVAFSYVICSESDGDSMTKITEPTMHVKYEDALESGIEYVIDNLI
jgi:hypothetical protein